MAPRIKPSAFDAARPLQDRILPQGWIWRGFVPLDGLCCLKSWFTDRGWIDALTPWLGHAAQVRETDEAIILLFDTPVEADCSQLGRVLPLRRIDKTLTSFPFVISGVPGDVVNALQDQLVIVDGGERVMRPLSIFQPADVAGWWDFSDVRGQDCDGPPRKLSPWKASGSRSSTPFDPDAFDAGFKKIRQRIGRDTPHGDGSLGKAFLAGLNNILRLAIWIAIVAFAIHLLRKLSAGEAAAAITDAIMAGILFFILIFIVWGVGKLRHPGKTPHAAGPRSTRRMPPSPAKSLWASSIAFLGNVILGFLIIGVIIYFVGTLVSGDITSAIGALVAFYVIMILYPLFRTSQKPVGAPEDGRGQTGHGAENATPAEAEPGILRRMAGWLLWSSALGKGVRNKYEARLHELEALFSQNKIDEALRKALALGKEDDENEPKKRQWFGDFPTGGPGIRDQLNIRYFARQSRAYGILTGPGFEALRQMYRQQADALAEQGDTERAAFIYAELLGDVDAAVSLFERRSDFETAAKLAQGRRLPPSRFIPLWFKAGEKKHALALAAKYDAFAELEINVPKTDSFHREVVTAWAQRLADTGNFQQALTLTEKFADLAAERQSWVARALARDKHDPVLLARALRSMPDWNGPELQQRLKTLLAETGKEAAARRVELASRLADDRFEAAVTEPAYLTARLPYLALPLLRRLLADEAEFGADKARRDAALALAQTSGQRALRVDIRRMNRITRTAEPPPAKHAILALTPDLAPIRDAARVAGDRLLVAYENGALHLINHDGRRLWSDHVHAVRGLVPIDVGHMIIVVRDDVTGTALSLLNLDDRSHKEIGFFDLQTFHRSASETGWFIYGGGQATMIDTASIIAAAKRGGGPLDHHWKVPVTEPGRLLCFLDQARNASFLYQRKDGGLLEDWTLNKMNLQVTCSFITATDAPPSEVQTFGWTGHALFYAGYGDGGTIKQLPARHSDYSLEEERQLLKADAGWLLPKQHIASFHAAEKPLGWSACTSGAVAGSVPIAGGPKAAGGVTCAARYLALSKAAFSAEFPDASWAAVRTVRTSAIAVMFDNRGRILAVDCERAQVLWRSDR